MYKLIVVQDNFSGDVDELNSALEVGWEIEQSLPRPFATHYILKNPSKPVPPLNFPLCSPLNYRGDIKDINGDYEYVAVMVPIGSIVVVPDKRAYSVNKY